MDPQKLEDYLKIRNPKSAIQNRPKAVIPVHLFGQPADMDPIMNIARKHDLFVIEDSCQAHGAEYKDRRAGSIGDTGCFSFYPGKNLGAYGEAGAITTNNDQLAEKMCMFRDHGQSKKYYHKMIGWNCRMDGFQGAVLSVKLKHLPSWNEARRNNAQLYNKIFSGIDKVIEPFEADYARHVYHVYAVRTQNRNDFILKLADRDIFCGIHYPVPVHLQRAYDSLKNKDGNHPVAERCAEQYVSLPMFPELTENQIEYIAENIIEFFKS
jgi:dTDP-4-amino-4,6-dideoxygalactose transaminase